MAQLVERFDIRGGDQHTIGSDITKAVEWEGRFSYFVKIEDIKQDGLKRTVQPNLKDSKRDKVVGESVIIIGGKAA